MIEYISQDTTRTYYVVFDTYRGARMFWHWFTGKEYAHCYLLTELEGGTLLRINPNCAECFIDEWFCDIDYAMDYLKDTTSILRYVCKYNSLKLYIPRGIVSCVSVTKYILGLRGVGLNAFTPRGLHKQLLKLGAEDMGNRKQVQAPQAQGQSSTGNAAYDAKYNEYITRNQANIAGANEAVRQQFYDEADNQAKQAAGMQNNDAPKATIQPVKSEAVKQIETLKGIESPEDIAAREKSTLANPKKAKVRGRRSLVSGASLGTGVTASRETLG